MSDLEIRPWSPDLPVAPITTLLHAAYAPLAGMGFRYTATHQDDDMTFQRLSAGWSFLAFTGNSLTGTISLRSSNPASECPWYRRAGVFTFGQFGVSPEHQRQGIGRALLEHVEDRAASEGAEELALDTAEGADHLIRWYQSLGYREIDRVSWPDTNYRSVVLSKPLRSPARPGNTAVGVG
jgi:GNAT superfamily N-acetyltransferase